MVILIGVLIAAVFTDMRRYKIPNLCIAIGMLAGLIMTLVSYHVSGVIMAIIQMAMIFAIFYPFYLIGGLGAGDVKLFMMMGCWLQGERLIGYMFVTMIIAGIISVVKILFIEDSRQRMHYLGRYVRKAVFTGTVDEYEVNILNRKGVIRLSVPALTGLILMYLGAY